MPVSAGAQADTSPPNFEDSTKSFFLRLLNFFQNAEHHYKDESFAYLPINHLLVRLADACRHNDQGAAIGAVPQFAFKNSKSLRRRIPDYSVIITFLRWLLFGKEDQQARDALLLLIWEVKPFSELPWNSAQEDERDGILMRAERFIEGYLSQLSEQALFAFYRFEGNAIPSILSQGNCFTLLVYYRPQNWDALMVKYAEELRASAEASTGTSRNSKAPAPSTSQGQRSQVLPATPATERTMLPEVIPQNADSPTIVAKELPSGSTEDPSAQAEEPESAFELGDLPVPEARASGFMVSPDGMGFTDEFLDAVQIIIGLNGDVTISPDDPVFDARPPAQDVSVQDSLDNVKDAIKNFQTQQKAKKAPEPIPEVDEGPSAVPSEFVDPNAAKLRSPPPGKYWALRSGQVDWKTTAELEMLEDARRKAEAAKAAARPSKKRKLNRSGDAAPTADAQETASGLTASANTYRPPAMGTRSRTKSTAARIAEHAVAGPSQLARGPPPGGRNKVQDRKRKDNKKSRE